jgi:hypothetical protein
MKDFGVVEALHQWSRLTQDLSRKLFIVLPFRKFGGLCTLTRVREKPGGREKANRGKKRERGRRGRGRKGEKEEKRKRDEEKRRCIRPVRLRVCAKISRRRYF